MLADKPQNITHWENQNDRYEAGADTYAVTKRKQIKKWTEEETFHRCGRKQRLFDKIIQNATIYEKNMAELDSKRQSSQARDNKSQLMLSVISRKKEAVFSGNQDNLNINIIVDENPIEMKLGQGGLKTHQHKQMASLGRETQFQKSKQLMPTSLYLAGRQTLFARVQSKHAESFINNS